MVELEDKAAQEESSGDTTAKVRNHPSAPTRMQKCGSENRLIILNTEVWRCGDRKSSNNSFNSVSDENAAIDLIFLSRWSQLR